MMMERIEVIQKVLNKYNGHTYLEIGVMTGRCFFKINAPKKIAVDPNFRIPLKRKIFGFNHYFKSTFLEITSDEFFENHIDTIENGIDVAFVDGLHVHEQSLLDVQNCLENLNNNGIIIVHDCLPPNAPAAHPDLEEARKLEGYTDQWCGNVYKTILSLLANHDDLRISVLDCDYGLGVIKKGKPHDIKRTLSNKEIKELSFDEFSNLKNDLINIQPFEYLETILNE